MVRIAIGGLVHESNTFAPSRADLASFVAGSLETGPGLVARWGDAHHEVGGFFEGAKVHGFEPVPTLMAWAMPSGPVEAETYRELVDRLLAAIEAAGHVDAVLLALHGAMVVEGLDDADGTTLVRVRDLIGPQCPLVATLDYHANISPLMARTADALLAYRTYPHIDQRTRGVQAARLALLAARQQIRPVQAIRKPPLLINLLAQTTEREPLRSLMADLEELDPSPTFLDASLAAGFPFADTPATGPTCIAITDNDPALAAELADRLAARLWSARKELTASPPGVAGAVAAALATRETPVVLVDVGDNVGGGSAADSTVLIHELLRQGIDRAIVVLYDPDAVAACVRAGVGCDVEVETGGKVDRNAPPLPVRGRVRVLHDGRYLEDLPRHGGIRLNDQGLTAVVEFGSENPVVLTSLRHPPFSLGQLTSLGLRPEAARVIVVKAAVAYRTAYAPIAGAIIEVDTPGLTASNPARFTYKKLRRPILPLDPEDEVEAPVP